MRTEARLDRLLTTLGVLGTLLVAGGAWAAWEQGAWAWLGFAAYGGFLARLADAARRFTWGARPVLLAWCLPLLPLWPWAVSVLCGAPARRRWRERARPPVAAFRCAVRFGSAAAAAAAIAGVIIARG